MYSSGQRFEKLQADGKRLAAEGRLKESLSKFLEAKTLMETPKINSRIQKLKDAIANSSGSDSTPPTCQSTGSESFQRLEIKKKNYDKSYDEPKSGGQVTKVLSEIENFENAQNVSRPALSAAILKKFNALKESALELSYDGKFKEALEAFTEALKLYDCPKIKKYIQEMEIMIAKHEEKLQRFQHLTDTGKKLASEGRQSGSLKKLKDAFAVCPSPKVSKIIKMLEVQAETPVKSLSSESSEENVFKVPTVIPRNLQSGSSHSDDSDFQTVRVKSESNDKAAELSSLSPDRLQQYKNLYSKARESAASGNLKVAMDALNKAKSICPTEKVLKRIKDLKEHIKSSSEEASDDHMVAVADGFYVFHEIYEKLYPYQRKGVAWMWELFKKKKGGVLGDDMGLGKTFQVIAFLSGLIDADRAKHILIVMPVSLLTNWENEFQKWCPGISVCLFHGGTKREKERNILRVQRKGHVLLTSYGMVLNGFESLSEYEGRQFVWDFVILDEGHKIKNPTKTTKAVHNIPSRNRLVLTGTPIQNNLRELWALYDFAHQGALVGSVKTFKMQYENPITRAREKDATPGEKRLGTEMAENLRMLIEPYFLRRTKAEIWGKPGENADINDLEKSMDQLRVSDNKLTTRKNDLIMWTFMSNAQCEIYKKFLHSDDVKRIFLTKRSPLVELTTLKKICDHPRLLSQRACLQLGLNGELNEEDLDDETSNASSIENVSDDTLIEESGKLRLLIDLLVNLRENGHRTLVFSLSRKILDMVHRILVNRSWKVLRLDGTITKMEERERRIQLFQTDPSYSVFLLTTQVGGVGITLTAADRAVIYDPSWNPATDAQAVDRVYRIGQKKNVVVYRLITCGTVEEKIYRRQIFKDSITKQVTGTAADPNRYFSKQELRDLFTLDDPYHSATQVQLNQLHSDQRNTDVSLDEHIAFLHNLNIFGISDHDLMFTKDIVDDTEDNDEGAVSHEYIKKQVAVARQLIQGEASVVEEGMRLAGSYTRPYLENIPTFKNNTAKDLYKPPSEIKTSYPSVTSLYSKNINDTDNKKSNVDYRAYGDSSRVSEIIDLCDSPQKSTSKCDDKINSPRFSRSSGTYETLMLVKKKINSYFYPVLKQEDCHNLKSNESSSSTSDNVFAEKFYTPELCPSGQPPNFSSEEKSQRASHSSVLINLPATPIKVTQNEQDTDVNHISQTETAITKNSSFLSLSINDEQPQKFSFEKDVFLSNTLGQADEKSLGSVQPAMPIDEKNASSENCVKDTSTVNISSSPCKDTSDSGSATTQDCSIHDDPATPSKDEISLTHEDSCGDISTRSLNHSEVNELSHNCTTTSRGDESIVEDEDADLNSITSEENESVISEEPPENLSKADSVHNASVMSANESMTSEDALGEQDNLESVEDLVEKNSDFNESCEIIEVPSDHISKTNASPYSNIAEIQKTDISFDLDSSMYDEPIIGSSQPSIIRNPRKSCAIQKSIINYESDSSQNISSADASDAEIVESDSEFSDNSDLGSPIKEVDSSMSFVPNSIPNSPFVAIPKVPNSPVRGITPLRLRDSFVSLPNSAFALAVATSPLFASITQSPAVSSPPRKKSRDVGFHSEEDSPVNVRKVKKHIIVSDSEED